MGKIQSGKTASRKPIFYLSVSFYLFILFFEKSCATFLALFSAFLRVQTRILWSGVCNCVSARLQMYSEGSQFEVCSPPTSTLKALLFSCCNCNLVFHIYVCRAFATYISLSE